MMKRKKKEKNRKKYQETLKNVSQKTRNFFFLDQVSGSRDILLVEDRRDHGNRLLKIDCKIQDDRWIIDNGSI